MGSSSKGADTVSNTTKSMTAGCETQEADSDEGVFSSICWARVAESGAAVAADQIPQRIFPSPVVTSVSAVKLSRRLRTAEDGFKIWNGRLRSHEELKVSSKVSQSPAVPDTMYKPASASVSGPISMASPVSVKPLGPLQL